MTNTDAESTPNSNGTAAPVADSAKLYLKIFGDLKKEVASFVKEARDTERNTLLYCGAIIAFISAHGVDTKLALLVYLPLVLSLFGGARVLLLMKDVGPRRTYLKEIEKNVFRKNPPIEGWETYREREEKSKLTMGSSIWVFWPTLIILTALFPLLLKNDVLTTEKCKSPTELNHSK